jgi:diadenylate cyclase
VSLFVPESLNKLHDGAVIIRNLRVAKAGVFFPMPDTKVLDKSLGSRHRAALGITEETDAVVVVVSEERGTISFCFNGNIVTNLDGASLRQALLGLVGQARKKKQPIKRTGPQSERGTGSFRITLPPPSPSPPGATPPSDRRPAPPLESVPPIPRPAPSSLELPAAAQPPRPMASAKPIETPAPQAAPAAPAIPTPPSGPREES